MIKIKHFSKRLDWICILNSRTNSSILGLDISIWQQGKNYIPEKVKEEFVSFLYQVSIPTINEHIKNILSDGEIDSSTIREFLIVQKEGKRQIERKVNHYNFQMVLAIGYRVRSNVGIHFRKWASNILTEYSKKGFAMNDERLKNPKPFGVDYFDELLERIRDIRASQDLDIANEVCVYAKLPKGFAIPTPVGNYSPDWAIAFNEGIVKHIYFIAEAKGTMKSLNLRPIEQAKISCAKKLFNEISTSNVKYHDVGSYQSLLNIMNSL